MHEMSFHKQSISAEKTIQFEKIGKLVWLPAVILSWKKFFL